MKYILLLVISIALTIFPLNAQNLDFTNVYQNHPTIPKGILEAVSWTNTHMNNIDESYQESCTGMPLPYGVMGVFENGADWFIENGKLIAQISGISVEDQKLSVQLQLEAYAFAFEYFYNQYSEQPFERRLYSTLKALTNIEENDNVDAYAIDSQIYDILNTFNNNSFANTHNYPEQDLDLAIAFGEANFQVLSSPNVLIKSTGIETAEGVSFIPNELTNRVTTIWNPAASCNYSSRGGTAISAITIHTVQGSYSSCINWFKNCAAQVSAHYVLRSSDGQITYMVDETNKAWHVGSENPYTIGFEHEGWVEQDGWYTSALYNASADLVKDICTRRNLNRKRAAYYPWTKSTYYNQSGIPGSCNIIKGHQHYPNQTHNDPGIRWNWEHFDNLINDNVPTTTITNTSGTIYDSGGATGNYSNDERKRWLIAPTGAAKVSLTFTSFNTENTWDYLYIYNGSNTSAPLIGKYTGTSSPGTVTGTSGKLYLLFKSECATTQAGWAANISIVPSAPVDDTSPTTDVAFSGNWQTDDFTVTYTDADEPGGSGVKKSFYQVLEYNGHNWYSNRDNGFFADNFDSTDLAYFWTNTLGSWGTSNNYLHQSDEGNGNTNINAPLNQSLSNQYLYTWSMKISGSGTNRRAGLHIFSDNPTQTERGNCYLIFFRVDANLPENQPNKEVQIYKIVNNALTLVKQEDYTINANTWYNYAVRYDRITGELAVYVNDNLVMSWTDPTPIATGNAISFRSGNCILDANNIKAYRSRFPSNTITVGPAATNDIRYQNSDPSTPAGRVKSMVVDNAGNLSAVAYKDVNVDWTPPQDLIVNDGIGADIDTTNSTTLQANWGTVNDPHSDVSSYELAIGTTPGGDDIYAWSGNNLGLNTSIAYVLTNPIYEQIYYISIKATNNAGLTATASSDGQRLVESTSGIEQDNIQKVVMYPNPSSKEISFENINGEMKLLLYDMNGKLIQESSISTTNNVINIEHLSSGSYNVILKSNTQFIVKKLIKE